ncbi:MAG: GlmU family protein [Ginsengibacter sp.]
MAIILDDITNKAAFYPFTNVRSLADVRMGIFTFGERWSYVTNDTVYVVSEIEDNIAYDYQEKFPANSVIDDQTWHGEKEFKITSPWDIIANNAIAIENDFNIITKNKTSQKLSITNNLINEPKIFVEKGVKAEFVTLNASAGPIYIGKNVEIMEGAIIRGPVAICNNAIIKMGARLYSGTTIGPNCIAGGEIKNSILNSFSNKSHDGYLGDSIIGYWCNLGAGTSNSNVKNSAGRIKVWNYETKDFIDNGNKCGLLMGDYSRSAINTSFNTGTVVGTCCNVFTKNFPPKHIPDFTWGTQKYDIDKALNDINNWKQLKGKELNEKEKRSLIKYYSN